MSYTIRYNRSSNHIDGIAARTQTAGTESNGVVSYYAETVCGALTRGAFAEGATFETLTEAVKAAELNARINNRKMCKNCSKAAEEVLAQG